MMGKMHTPQELIDAYPFQTDGECVLTYVSANVVGGIDGLDMLSDSFRIDESDKTPQQILDEIIYKMDNPPIPEPTSEERIASALEYQNIMNY